MFYNYYTFPLIILLATSWALPSPHSPLTNHQRDQTYSTVPIPPRQDPFYTAPAGFESSSPGTILRIRPAPGNLTSVVANCSSAYNIIYRTTDAQYKPSFALTTFYIPSKNASRNALLSYQIPYNSVDLDSSPSYDFYTSPIPDVATALGNGWFVNVPDHEGPLAAFASGITEGHSVLDSIRAVLSSRLGLETEARIALWGYSGGSLASEWALEFHEQYAPELKISGAALGGLVANGTSTFALATGTIWGSLPIAGMVGVLTPYPDSYEFMVSQLKTSGPHNKTGFLAIKEMSFSQGHDAFLDANIWDYFVNGPALLEVPLIKNVFLENTIMTYHGVPRVPLFIYMAVKDELTLVTATDAYVERNCLLGTNILYQRNTAGGHLDEYTNGIPRALAWLESVLDGTYVEKHQTDGCKIEEVTVAIVDTGI